MLEDQDRRGFLARMSTAAAALWAAGLTSACDAIGLNTENDDFEMHGPVRQNEKVLQLPEAPAMRDLLTPYHDGRPFMRRWAVGHVAKGKRGQVTILLVDLDSGGHAELDLYGRDPALKPLARTTYYDVTARYLRFLDDCWSDEAFVQAIRKLGLDAAHNFAKAMLSLHVTTRSLQCHADDPRPPGPTADNPSGGFEAFARSLM